LWTVPIHDLGHRGELLGGQTHTGKVANIGGGQTHWISIMLIVQPVGTWL
jgi:hypothetical protein